MIAQIAEHWIRPDAMEQGEMLYRDNGAAMKKAPGFVMRMVWISKTDPNKITTVSVWRDEESHQNWNQRNTEHIHDGYGQPTRVPSGTEYHEKYGDLPSPLSRVAEIEDYNVIEASL
jgi:heme-degrading monooxygenase HmoA